MRSPPREGPHDSTSNTLQGVVNGANVTSPPSLVNSFLVFRYMIRHWIRPIWASFSCLMSYGIYIRKGIA
jgi:hypothetical protein